jgi:hypothetical protein
MGFIALMKARIEVIVGSVQRVFKNLNGIAVSEVRKKNA